jgi:hypothetical protein
MGGAGDLRMATIRKYKDGGRVTAVELVSGATADQSAAADVPTDDDLLVRQLADLKAAEEHARHQPPQPPPSEHKRQLMQANPHLARQGNLLGQVHHELTSAGYQDDSPEYYLALTRRLNAAGIYVAHPGEQQDDLPPPERPIDNRPFSMPEEREPAASAYSLPPAPPAPRRQSLPVSAPVSRAVPSYQGGRSAVPSRVHLSAEERQAAAFSGISDTEYAANKIRLIQAKEAGMYPDGDR